MLSTAIISSRTPGSSSRTPGSLLCRFSSRVPAKVLASVPHMRILVISVNENAAYVRAIFATGVLGYILKSASQSELFQAIKQVYRGRRFIDPRLKDSLSEHLLSPITDPATKPTKRLSMRENEVTCGCTGLQVGRFLRN
jgi:DNA-binding NarL/FixJ family response regulator